MTEPVPENSNNEKFAQMVSLEQHKKESINELIEYNHKITQVLREMAGDFSKISEAFQMQAERAKHVAEMCAVGAKLNADLTGDIIATEFNILEIEPDQDDEDDDEANP